jgi:hypothetical protein
VCGVAHTQAGARSLADSEHPDVILMDVSLLSDEELRDKLSSGELSDKKATTARAILRRRRQERLQAWFKRHAWLAALLTALGLASIFSVRPSASDEASE